MTTNLRTEKFLSAILPTVGLAWATHRPALATDETEELDPHERPTIKNIVLPSIEPTIVVEPSHDVWVLDAADALALAWAAHR